jgi:hypothetical protein
MRPATAALAIVVLMAPGGNAAVAQDAAREVTLSLPRPLAAGDTPFLEVQVGPVARGRTIGITTATGQPLGTVAPFGGRAGADAGTFTVPVPRDAARDGRLTVRLTISQPDGSTRAPSAEEVRGVKLGTAPR